MIDPDNFASQRVLEKLGLKYIRDDFHNTKVRVFETINDRHNEINHIEIYKSNVYRQFRHL